MTFLTPALPSFAYILSLHLTFIVVKFTAMYSLEGDYINILDGESRTL